MIEWIWRQIGIELPADWECLQFARDPVMGRCAFADRHRYRCELSWRKFKAEPDFERMIKDYANSLESQWQDIKTIRCRGMPGLIGRRGDEFVSRFGTYLPGAGILIELVFIHPDERDDKLEARILPTLREVLPDADGLQQWRAFGMDMRVPATFTLGECKVEPTRVGLKFEGDTAADRWIFRRYALVDEWLKQPLRDWLAGQHDEFVRDPRPETITRGNEHMERVSGRWKPKGLLLRGGHYAAAAWRNQVDRRLYHVICITSRKNQNLHPQRGADERLRATPEFLAVPTSAQ